MTRIKVSGLTEPADAEAAASHGSDIISCVFWAPSPRYTSVRRAWEIRSAIPAHVAFAGIFVNTPLPIVHHTAIQAGLDMIHLFGQETRDAVEAAGPAAFKGVTVADREQLDTALRTYGGRRSKSDGIPSLMIHLTEDVAAEWPSVAAQAERAPLLLAADALDSETVSEAVTTVKPWGIDVWEAVEIEPGRLSADRLERLVAAIRQVDAVGG